MDNYLSSQPTSLDQSALNSGIIHLYIHPTLLFLTLTSTSPPSLPPRMTNWCHPQMWRTLLRPSTCLSRCACTCKEEALGMVSSQPSPTNSLTMRNWSASSTTIEGGCVDEKLDDWMGSGPRGSLLLVLALCNSPSLSMLYFLLLLFSCHCLCCFKIIFKALLEIAEKRILRTIKFREFYEDKVGIK